MLRDAAILLTIGVIAALIAAGGAWWIPAVCLAVLVLLPASLIGLRRHFTAANRFRRSLDRVQRASSDAEHNVPAPWLP